MPTDAERYSRQIRLQEVGVEGQRRLQAARVLVVGCGGLGSPVIQYLACAGIGALTLVDDDVVEGSNLNRQSLHRERDIGRPKAERAAEWVGELNATLKVRAVLDRVSTSNAREMVRQHEVVVDCTDGLPIKYLLNDACVLEKRALVHGAVVSMSGQVFVVPPGGGPCLRCLFAEIPAADEVPSCQVAGVLGAVCGIVGAVMATEAVKVVLGLGGTLVGRYLAVDALAADIRTMRFERDLRCEVCGERPTVDARRSQDYVAHCDRLPSA